MRLQVSVGILILHIFIWVISLIKSYQNNKKPLKIRYGTIDRSNNQNELIVYKIVVHENYDPASMDHDVAILRLIDFFDPNTGARVISMTNETPKAGDPLFFTGWGRNSPTGSMTTKLSYTYLYAQTLKTCLKSWAGQKLITENMMCAYSPHTASCMGDQGSPITNNGKLLGVLSYQPVGCLDDRLPSVYTDLTSLSIQNWISRHTSTDL